MKGKSADCRRLVWLIAVAAGAAACGCATGPDVEYGLSRGSSLNGTSAFATMLRERGHEVRAAIRLSDELADWAEGIVRFAPYPGPPEEDEAQWYRSWLAQSRDRWLIYVVGDFHAEHEYWKSLVEQLAAPEAGGGIDRAHAEEKRTESADWVSRLPPKAEHPAPASAWFETGEAVTPPAVGIKLAGAWAVDVDAKEAALTLHEPLRADARTVLLEADGQPFVVDKSTIGRGRVLVIANGSFLLNEALAHPGRRPLAERVAAWPRNKAKRVAFAEGSHVLAGDQGPDSIWKLFERLPMLRWIAVQLGLAGAIAALARAWRLGRPRSEPDLRVDRPAAHAEALGALLESAGAADEAHEQLSRYRHWRHLQISREPSRNSGRAGQFAHARAGGSGTAPPQASEPADSGPIHDGR